MSLLNQVFFCHKYDEIAITMLMIEVSEQLFIKLLLHHDNKTKKKRQNYTNIVILIVWIDLCPIVICKNEWQLVYINHHIVC